MHIHKYHVIEDMEDQCYGEWPLIKTDLRIHHFVASAFFTMEYYTIGGCKKATIFQSIK